MNRRLAALTLLAMALFHRRGGGGNRHRLLARRPRHDLDELHRAHPLTMRNLISIPLITIAACQSGDDGVLRCVYYATSWQHRLSDDVWNCGGTVPPPMILGVAGPGTWVEAASTWTGRVVVLGGDDAGYRMTHQLCLADIPGEPIDLVPDDCGPNSSYVEPEINVEGGLLSLTVPPLPPELAAECEDESQWRDPAYEIDPGPRVGKNCNMYFGTILRLYNTDYKIVSESFAHLIYYHTFPNDPGDGQFATLGVPEAEQDGEVVHVRVPASINPRLARYLTDIWGETHGGFLGVFPSAGSYPERFRFDIAPRTGDDVDLSFDWEPGDATSADIVLVHNLKTPVFGWEASSIGYHPLRLTRDGDAWNVVALDLNEWLDE